MRYQGSEALYMDYAEGGRAFEQEVERPSLEVLPGGGLDARVRRGVSAEFLSKVARVLAVAAVFIALGFVRVCVSSATVAALTENSSLRAQVNDAKNLNDELKIERAVLSSNSRIARIATQNYGMVLSNDAVSVAVGEAAQAEAAEQAAAEASEAARAQADADSQSAAAVADEGLAATEAEQLLNPYAFATAALQADGDAAQLVSEVSSAADVA